MTKRLKGIVKWFNNERGFGFVHPYIDEYNVNESVEYFVHFTSINMEGFKSLTANQLITFELKETPKGIQAINVNLVK